MINVPQANPILTYGSWDHLERRVRGAVPALLLFAAVYLPLTCLDHAIRETQAASTVLRPSIGLLLVAVWFSKPSRWPAFLGIHVIAALLAASWFDGTFSTQSAWFEVVPGAISAVVGALACRVLLRKTVGVQVVRVPVGVAGVVAGCLCGACAAALLRSAETPNVMPLLRAVAAFSVEHALGVMATGPIVLTWMQRLRHQAPELELRSRRELLWLSVWTMTPVLAGWLFLREANSSLLPVPLVAGPALLLASLRLPPRWAVTLAAGFVLSFSAVAASRHAPYSVADPAVRVGLQQMLAGIFVLVPFILSVGITELRITLSRLFAEQQRLQAYARMISVAEEKVRRGTAVDLHDGIGQTLAGMQMMVDAARQHPPARYEALLEELALRLREVQGHTRRMICDLSPPGLYELGLEPALRWLCMHLQGQDGLEVTLSCEVDEEAIPVDARVLVFKVVRELLRNVVKHSGVKSARVEAKADMRGLMLVVSDAGQGFDHQVRASNDPGNGFGLWSIAERVREHGGSFRIDSVPGSGARFELELQLSQLRG